MKRIYYETIKKWAVRIGIVGSTSIGLIFMYLIAIGSISNVSYSPSSVCAGTIEDPCYALINFTANEDIFIYPTNYDPWGRNTIFSFDPNVKSWKLERSWGKSWREINLSKTCQYTWCGAPKNGMIDNKYAYAFRKGRTYQIRITGYKNNPTDTIKWGAFSGVDEIDPTWYGIPERYTPLYHIGEVCNSSYDSVNKIMTDTSCLQFKTETNGVITVNNERYLAFALKGIIDGNEITKTSMDFSWTWHMNESNGDYVFWAENNNSNFIWRQYYYFYEDYSKPMKIEHYLENNLDDITDMQMYYLTNVLPTDEIKYNETNYLVSDYMGLHKQGNFNELISTINFNAMYDFNFEDLVKDGFTINEFYIGSGSVIGKPEIDITAIGFTKNNGNFPKGTSVWIDPTFSTSNIRSISVTPLDNRKFVVAWSEGAFNVSQFQIFDIYGKSITPEIVVDGKSTTLDYTSISVTQLDSTSFVIGWYDGSNILFAIYDDNGNELVSPVTVATSVGSSNSVSVSAFSSSEFVIGWYDRTNLDVTFRIYNSAGSALHGPIDASDDVGYSNAVSVSAFSSSEFVIGWYNRDSTNGYGYKFRIYNSAGSALHGPIDISTEELSNGRAISVSALNSTAFVAGWYDDPAENISFSIYDNDGTQLVSPVVVDSTAGPTSNSVSVSAINSTAFVIGWFDDGEDDQDFAVYDTGGNLLHGPIESSSDGSSYQAVTSYQTATDIGILDVFQNPLIVHAYAVSTSQSDWKIYNTDGTAYIPPVFSLNITNPTTSSSKAVNSSDNISINFNFQADGVNLTSGVSIGDVLIGGSESSIIGEQFGVPTIELYTTQTETTPTTTITLEKPEGVEVGELLLLIAANDDSSPTSFINNKEGWKFIGGFGSGVSDSHVGLFYKIADGNEPQTEEIIQAGSDEWVGWYVRISGVDTLDPINIIGSPAITASTNINAPAIETDKDNTLALAFGAFDGGDGDILSLTGTGWNQESVLRSGTTTDDGHGVWGYKEMTSQGSTLVANIAASSSDGMVGVQFAINGWGFVKEFDYIDGVGWQVNVTVPEFESGLKDLFINATWEGYTRNDTQTNAINYGGGGDTCTYTSGNWNVDCADNCSITSNVDLGNNNLTLTGAGHFDINAIISNFDKIVKYNNCQINIFSGGIS